MWDMPGRHLPIHTHARGTAALNGGGVGSAMTSAPNAARERAPSWDDLVAIGLAVLARPRQILWAIVSGVFLAAVQRYVPGESGLAVVLFPFVIVAYLWIELILSRQFLLGYFTIDGSDLGAILRLVGLILLAVVALTVVLAPLAYMFSLSSKSTTLAFYVTGALTAIFLRTRLAFYVPALSVGDNTSLRQAFDQSKPYSATILAVLIAIAVPTYGLDWLVGKLHLPSLASAAIEGTISACRAIITAAALCHLYASQVRPRTGDSPTPGPGLNTSSG
jgi:hypothetical protein